MKKKIIYLSIILVLVISLITLSSIYKSKDNKYKKEYNTISKGMAIMIKEKGATDYVQSNSKDIPKGNYVLNEEKTHCENNGKVTNYNSATGTVSLNFIGSDRCYLYFDYEVPPRIGYEAILLDNGNGATTVDEAKAYIEGRTTSTTPDFSTVATTNEGMYAADDDYTATTGMKSYYFRGAVDNNWVKFGKYTKDMYNCNDNGTISFTDTGNSCTKIASNGDDIYWRIIRINGDGSIRMIYSGVTPPTESTKVIKTTDTSLGNSSYYGGIGLGDWYKTTTLETDSATKILVADEIFCADKTTSSPQIQPQTPVFRAPAPFLLYGASVRLSSKKPILTCPTASDKFTVGTSNGNGALTYPVGLITADEIVMAGGRAENSSYYLYTSQNYWSYSPAHTAGDNYYYFFVDSSGGVQSNSMSRYYGTRPVISLSSKAKLSGSGTYNDIYTVVGEGNSTEDTSSGKSFDTVFAANNTDIFPENGLRYEGADPNNYICLDNKTSGACSSSSLLFRIIGLFDEEYSSNGTTSSGTKKLLKVIDTNNFGGTDGKYWNRTQTSGKNYNDWSTATLKTELNDTYLSALLATSGVNSKLESAIITSKWHLGGAGLSNYQTLTAEGIYTEERNTSAISSGNPSSIYAKVGLMYPSDFGYATVGGTTTNKTGCRAKELYNWNSSSYSDCKNNDWIFTSQNSFADNREWLLSPYSMNSTDAAHLYSGGYVHLNGYRVVGGKFAVRPTFYLDSSILKIVGTGDGSSSNPYRVG